MINKLVEWVHGYIYIIISGENISRFLNICSARNFIFPTIEYIESNVLIKISIKDFFRINPIVRKCRIKVHIVRKCGLPFWIKVYKKRQMMFLGILSSFVIMYVLSLYIWQIDVVGNYTYSEEEILDFINELGVKHGIKKDKIVGEELEKAIRNKYFDITWVSAELTGTRLILHIKENFNEIKTEEDNKSSGLISDSYDVLSHEKGIIASIVVRRGTAMVKVGDVINPNDVLIKGEYDIVNDSGEVIEKKTTKGDGTIYIYARYEFNSELLMDYKAKEYVNVKNNYTLAIDRLIFDFSFLGSNNENVDKILEVSQLKLTENYYLPIYVYNNKYLEYELVDKRYSEDECRAIMNERFDYFFENLSEKSIQIIENNVTIEFKDNKCIASGDIVVLKEIE